MSFENDSLQSKLHSALKINDLWPQFLESIAEELVIERSNSSILQYHNDVENLTDSNELIALCEKFGYIPNLILDDSLTFLKQEALSIPYRIRNKTTVNGYLFNFKIINKLGQIYTSIFNTNTLVKAIDWASIDSYLNSITLDPTIPFTNIIPNRLLTINIPEIPTLDSELTLDTFPVWHIDKNVSTLPTKHIFVEYDLNQTYTLNSETVLIYDDYFKYLEQGTQYNKRVPIVAHNGCQLSFFPSLDGSFDGFNTSLSYTIPLLQLKSSSTFLYPTTSFSSSMFKYFSVGNGSQSLLNATNKNIFASNDLILYYTFSRSTIINTITDYSTNNNTGNIHGDDAFVKGIIGQTLIFGGNDYIESNTSIALPSSTNLTFGFWFNASNLNASTSQYIFDLDIIKIQYNYATSNIVFTINNSLVFSNIATKNTDYFCLLELDYTAQTLAVYINATLVHTFDITGITYVGNYNLYIGCASTLSNFYQGIIDDLFILNKFLTSTEKTYIFSNLIGIVTKLASPLYRVPLQTDEVFYDVGKWLMLQSYAKSNSVSDEFVLEFVTGISTYNFFLSNNNISPNYLSLQFIRTDNDISITEIITDDGNGNLISNYASGTIDYTTGAITLNTYYQKPIYQQILATSSISSISTLLVSNVVPNTIRLFYVIENTEYIATDNGAGAILGIGIISGTINYSNGLINLSFSTTTTNFTFITIQYQYKIIPNIANHTSFIASYKVSDFLNISECAFENENKEVLIYATFPKVKFNTINNQLSVNALLKLS